ncbi:helix-turn-helix transcriptional regulator [Sulfurimonas sp.]|jgi:transcriptional regulator with XRE-family HTH domain|uniref:helix-turn-helix domain-containing protein n=1 Tax=Sulfurimonas sp. TaxID=2022749 RepID=UPI0025D70622|nr:helix-turn-helix transcriptional regulator [Sulfurimonas sp.]MBT5935050.1 helix-turn-helix transcriptional regulator [Sulfurimonas sp.]
MLLVQENINKIIKQQGMSKKYFTQRLLELKPTVRRIGEVPSVSAIYSYLNGRINIPVELISYVAEVLGVTEQELFDTSVESRKKCFKYFLQNAPKEELEYFNHFISSQIHNDININYGEVIMNSKTSDEKFTELLKYAPVDFMDRVLVKLEEYEKLNNMEF